MKEVNTPHFRFSQFGTIWWCGLVSPDTKTLLHIVQGNLTAVLYVRALHSPLTSQIPVPVLSNVRLGEIWRHANFFSNRRSSYLASGPLKLRKTPFFWKKHFFLLWDRSLMLYLKMISVKKHCQKWKNNWNRLSGYIFTAIGKNPRWPPFCAKIE